MATLAAFVVAGTVPLMSYVLPFPSEQRLAWSSVLTMAALFAVGAARAVVTVDTWWRSGVETLVLGAVVAAAAFGAGSLIAHLA
jgi:VIT1/CCC1 family predicted Fe2+/Mn2+ transporter